MPKLLISLPSGDISKELTADVVTIGRMPDNTVQVDHHSVSAHHARLTLSNGNYKIRDLESTNRTCVNGVPVNEAELTASCILRIGTVECVYKIQKPAVPNSPAQLQSQLSELQRQMDNLIKARDLISQQNRDLVRERDEAKNEAENHLDELNDAKKLIDRLSGGGTSNEQLRDLSAELCDAKKQIEVMSRERETLLTSNQELRDQVATLAAKLKEPRHDNGHAAAPAQSHVTVAAQQQAAARVSAEMDESVEEEHEEELAGAGQRTATAAAAGSRGGIFSGAPLLSSWLNRGAKRKNAAAEHTADASKIASMPAAQPEANNAGGAGAVADSPPTLRLVTPPHTQQKNDSGNNNAGSPAVKIGRVAANLAPQNPEIKPVWELLNRLRRSLHYFLRHQDELKVLQELAEGAHQLTEMSRSELLRPLFELAAALEALIADLQSSPANINPSTLRTVGQCIDFIATLIHESNLGQIKDVTTAKVFAIDDDEGILETIKATMEMVHLNVATSLQSSEGLTMLSEQNYDLILLDVGLPDMNGMDVCSRVRAMSHHQKTPIVFLTGEATVQNRVQSTLNGGNDLIGKPFSVLELAVKVIVWIFKGQLGMV